MLLYIYENHLGYLYISDVKLDYKRLHCDQCGDTDTLLGYASTKSEAWGVLKGETDTFDDNICKNCPHNDDYNYCDNECEDFIKHSGG